MSNHTNIEVYSFHDKYIILYDDHRSILNVFFETKKLGLFSTSLISMMMHAILELMLKTYLRNGVLKELKMFQVVISGLSLSSN